MALSAVQILKNIDSSTTVLQLDQLSDLTGSFVSVSSDAEQSISSDIKVLGDVTVGGLSVKDQTVPWSSIAGNVEDQKDLLDVNYPLDVPVEQRETVGGISYRRFDIKDHTIATITVPDSTPVRVHFPPKPTANFCRDFIVKMKVTSSEMPQLQFVKGENDDQIGFECTDEDWTNLEPGINYFTFTETERS